MQFLSTRNGLCLLDATALRLNLLFNFEPRVAATATMGSESQPLRGKAGLIQNKDFNNQSRLEIKFVSESHGSVARLARTEIYPGNDTERFIGKPHERG